MRSALINTTIIYIIDSLIMILRLKRIRWLKNTVRRRAKNRLLREFFRDNNDSDDDFGDSIDDILVEHLKKQKGNAT